MATFLKQYRVAKDATTGWTDELNTDGPVCLLGSAISSIYRKSMVIIMYVILADQD